MLDLEFVIATHDAIIENIGGLPGFAEGGPGGVDSALARIRNHIEYNQLDDVFGIAAMYAVAMARGHVFNDGNKRTGLTCALAYLDREGYPIPKDPGLEDAIVDLASGASSHDDFASYLSFLWLSTQPGQGEQTDLEDEDLEDSL